MTTAAAIAAAAAALVCLRRSPALYSRSTATPIGRYWRASRFSTAASEPAPASSAEPSPPSPPPRPPASTAASSWTERPEYRRWKDREAEIFEDIRPVMLLMKQILHSDRYVDGECLSSDDEKEVVEKLLAYHPHSEDKIGCGLDSIMVDRHPQFKKSRCLFVVRTDGGWIDFSYQKCIRAYIQQKYPDYAEKFIREHFKRH